MSTVTITGVRAILTAPEGIDLVVVKVETSEPGLYGLGCATFTQRARAVATAVNDYLPRLLQGRDVNRIEDIFQMLMVNAYWRNGPVLSNAVSGVDMALWDIKGKLAGMPVYDLLGGKCREAAAVYRHAGGNEFEQIADNVRRYMADGVRYVRVQCGRYGGEDETTPRPAGALPGVYYDPAVYVRRVPQMFASLRSQLGDEIELLHDVHERLYPAEAVRLAKELEPYRLYFLEDPLAPEDIAHLRLIKAQCATPIAIGELFNNPREWQPLIDEHLLDFVRMHISQMGGLTPARKVAAAAELHGIRTAWHGPGDVSPIGHMCNLHLDLACPNFGVQEYYGMSDRIREVFPGCPTLRDGYLYANEQPGWGMDLDEELAAKYPAVGASRADANTPNVILPPGWTEARRPDGGLARP